MVVVVTSAGRRSTMTVSGCRGGDVGYYVVSMAVGWLLPWEWNSL